MRKITASREGMGSIISPILDGIDFFNSSKAGEKMVEEVIRFSARSHFVWFNTTRCWHDVSSRAHVRKLQVLVVELSIDGPNAGALVAQHFLCMAFYRWGDITRYRRANYVVNATSQLQGLNWKVSITKTRLDRRLKASTLNTVLSSHTT